MRHSRLQDELLFHSQCAQHGFTSVRSNLYRSCGQGLLQVIMLSFLNKQSQRTHPVYEVNFGVFSLYSKLNWISSHAMRSILNYDLHTSFAINQIPGCEELRFFDPQEDTLILLEKSIPFFDALATHAQLAEELEKFDNRLFSGIRINDAQKISPYIISGQCEKAIACITAIEQQNLKAYAQNSQSFPGYNKKRNKKKIEERLTPLVSLREALARQDRGIILQYLQTNYNENAKKLHELGIPLSITCCIPQNQFPFPEIK